MKKFEKFLHVMREIVKPEPECSKTISNTENHMSGLKPKDATPVSEHSASEN